MNTNKLMVNLCAFAVVIGSLTGCATANYNKSASTAATLNKSSEMITQGSVQIDASLAALNDLVTNPQPDLRNQFQTYVSSVDALDATAKDVASENEAMKLQGAAYFNEWDNETATIHNEDIRNRSEARRNEVAAHFASISAQYDETRSAFLPYMSDLRDVQKFLANDLTSGGLAAIKEPAAKATTDATAVKESLDRLSDQFKDLGASMSPTTAAN
jgi:uncharacterized phage infection (PIP) family protein YhgE